MKAEQKTKTKTQEHKSTKQTKTGELKSKEENLRHNSTKVKDKQTKLLLVCLRVYINSFACLQGL